MKRLLILFLLSACAPGLVPDIVTEKGVSIFFRGSTTWEKVDVDEQEAWFVARLDRVSNGYRSWDVDRSLAKVEVDLYDDKIECGRASPTGYCNGLQNYNVLLIRNMGCVFNSAYTHELMHWLQQDIKNYTDYNHEEQNIWPIADGAPRGCTP